MTSLVSGRTNEISHAHLRVACDGQASALLHQLLVAVCDEQDLGLQQKIDALLSYGQSSGGYTLHGVQLVLSAITIGKLNSSMLKFS